LNIIPDNGGNGSKEKAYNPQKSKDEGKESEAEAGEGNGKEKSPQKESDQGPFMTERQRSYLFRLLAEKGLDGDVAHKGLKKAFKVTALKEVGRLQAKEMIEKLLKRVGSNDGGTQDELH